MGTSAIAQIATEGFEWSLTGLVLSAFGCFVIGSSALFVKHFSLEKYDWYYLALGLICAGIYISSGDPWITTLFAVIADLIMGIPMLIKAVRSPETERSPAWLIGLFSWTLTLTILPGHGWLYAVFPLYLFAFNASMVALTIRKQTG